MSDRLFKNLKKFICHACIVWGLLLPNHPAQAQTQDSIHIDLKKAIEIALDESPTIKVANRTIEAKQYSKREAIVALFPDANISGNYNYTLKKQTMVFQNQAFEVGTDVNVSGGLSISLPLISAALWKNVKLNDMSVELALESARSSKINLISQVKSYYYTMLYARETYQVLQQNYENAKLNYENVKKRYDIGQASEFEALRAEVNMKNQKPNVSAAESSIRLATMTLKVLIGVDVNEPIVFDGSLKDYEEEILNATIPKLNDLSLSENSSMKQLDLNAQQLQKSLEITQVSSLPSLYATGNYNYIGMGDGLNPGDYNWNPYAMVGFTVSIPIVSWITTNYKIKSNRLSLESIKDQQAELEQNLRISLTNSIVNLGNAIEDLQSNKETIIQANKAYEISQKQYEVGACTWLDLNAAEVALINSNLAYNQSIYNYLTASAELDATLGKTNE